MIIDWMSTSWGLERGPEHPAVRALEDPAVIGGGVERRGRRRVDHQRLRDLAGDARAARRPRRTAVDALEDGGEALGRLTPGIDEHRFRRVGCDPAGLHREAAADHG